MSTSKRKMSSTVLRAMSLFSGLQILTVACSVVRTKLIALWIGPEGVGLFGLFNNAIEMIGQVSHLGLRNSSVRDVVGAVGQRLAIIATVIRRWGVLLGLFGAILTLSLAKPLSEMTFGDSDHTWQFALLSVVLVFTSIINSEQAILQGLNMLRRLATASLWGAVGGLLVSIPMFWFWRVNSIVPSIIAYAVIVCAACLAYRAPTPKLERHINAADTMRIGKQFITLGIFMTLASFMDMFANYIFMAYLNVTTDTTEVGYYQAGYTLFNRYVGLIFSGIAMEFYPRITSVMTSRLRTSVFVNHELGLMTWIFVPVICVFVAAADPIVRILYASEFVTIVPFITLSIIGTIPRVFSWCLGITILARGDSKAFICTETFSAVSGLGLNILFYHLYGLTGLGAAYVIWYILYSAFVSVIYFRVYKLRLSSGALRMTLVAMLLTGLTAAASLLIGWVIPAIIAAVVSCVSVRKLLPILLHRH